MLLFFLSHPSLNTAMPHKSCHPNEPIVPRPANAPPWTNCVTTRPMSVIVKIHLTKRYLSTVKTTHGEILLKIQKSNPKISKFRRRPQYQIFSDRGKELIVSCNKRYGWTITWPDQSEKECKLKEYTKYCNATFSNPLEEGMCMGMSRKKNKILNKETSKVLTTVRSRSFWQRNYILMMDKEVDVVLMTGYMIAIEEILERRAAASLAGAGMMHGGMI